MARQSKKSASLGSARIWSYGCLPPVHVPHQKQLRAILYQSNRYQNILVRVERVRRHRYRVIRSSVGDLEQLETEHKTLREEIDIERDALKLLRKKNRKRSDHPAEQAALKAKRERAKALYARVKETRAAIEATFAPAENEYHQRRKKLANGGGPRIQETANQQARLEMLQEDWPELWKQIARLDAWAAHRIKQARKASGLPWGTYLLNDANMQAARKDSVMDPREKHFRGEGRVGIQIAAGLTLAELFSGTHKQIQIDPLPSTTWDTRPGRRRARTKLRMQLGTKKEPIMVEFRMILHRQLPSDAVIKRAWVNITTVGPQTKYELQLTLRSTQFKQAEGHGVAAVNFGWRAKEDGSLRIAYLVDEFGTKREYTLSKQLLDRMRYPEAISSISDKHFDVARSVMQEFLTKPYAPAWLHEATKNIGSWRRHSRLSMIANRLTMALFPDRKLLDAEWQAWKIARKDLDLFAPPADILGWCASRGWDAPSSMVIYLEWWRRKNRHLLQWCANQRENSLCGRRELYRRWSREMAKTYSTVLVEAFDLREVASRKALPEEEEKVFNEMRHIKSMAAIGKFRELIVSACGRAHVIQQPSQRNTLKCSSCGVVREVRSETIEQECLGCHKVLDQDENNCLNQLERYKATPPPVPEEVESPKAAE